MEDKEDGLVLGELQLLLDIGLVLAQQLRVTAKMRLWFSKLTQAVRVLAWSKTYSLTFPGA